MWPIDQLCIELGKIVEVKCHEDDKIICTYLDLKKGGNIQKTKENLHLIGYKMAFSTLKSPIFHFMTLFCSDATFVANAGRQVKVHSEIKLALPGSKERSLT